MGSILLKSFSSGSCGNCYFLGQEEDGRISAGVLIDAGVSLRRVKRELAAEGLGPDSFQAMLITHDHMDHIRSLGSFCSTCRSRYMPPVPCTRPLRTTFSRKGT